MMRDTGRNRRLRRTGALAALLTLAAPAAATETLSGSCFARAYDAAYLAAHPGQRVAAIAVQFHGFGDALLASVVWKLRYGTTFGFSGDCNAAAGGAFRCTSCTNGDCEAGGETFAVSWSGGDRLDIVNDATGLLAGNAAGGRDYLISHGAQRSFTLRRGSAADCAWQETALP